MQITTIEDLKKCEQLNFSYPDGLSLPTGDFTEYYDSPGKWIDGKNAGYKISYSLDLDVDSNEARIIKHTAPHGEELMWIFSQNSGKWEYASDSSLSATATCTKQWASAPPDDRRRDLNQCGNLIHDPGEICDPTASEGFTCADFGYSGTMQCPDDCADSVASIEEIGCEDTTDDFCNEYDGLEIRLRAGDNSGWLSVNKSTSFKNPGDNPGYGVKVRSNDGLDFEKFTVHCDHDENGAQYVQLENNRGYGDAGSKWLASRGDREYVGRGSNPDMTNKQWRPVRNDDGSWSFYSMEVHMFAYSWAAGEFMTFEDEPVPGTRFKAPMIFLDETVPGRLPACEVEGMPNCWNYWTTGTLPPGDYWFSVDGSDNEDVDLSVNINYTNIDDWQPPLCSEFSQSPDKHCSFRLSESAALRIQVNHRQGNAPYTIRGEAYL